MGNKLCCNEDRDPSLASKEEENNNNENNNNYNLNENERNNENNFNNLNSLHENNTIDSEKDNNDKKQNIKKENKYEVNNTDDINNMKSSIFDNDNDNENQNSENNEQNKNDDKEDSTANFKSISKKRNKSKNDSKNNIYSNINIKKKKSNMINLENEMIDIKNVIKNNPNYKNQPLKIKSYNDNKENEYYLINSPNYIGLKNTNSNLVFVKNNIQNIDLEDNAELVKTKKDIINNKREKQKNNVNIKDSDEDDNNKFKIIFSKYSISHKDSESINKDMNISTRNHNMPFDEKVTDKHYSSGSQQSNNENKIFDYINNAIVKENIHSNNKRLIEIYIKNQLRKIIDFLSNKTKRQSKSKKSINVDKIKDILNNKELKDNSFGENNQLIKSNNSNNDINDISLSFEVLNTSKCQTIMNKEKNFCLKFFSNGSVYIGEIKNDKLNGLGKFMNIKGDIILGYFDDNFFQGYNLIQRNQNNSRFEGQFEKNKFNGYGIEQFSDGSAYFGQFKNNEKSGIGTYAWGNGCQYQGEWKNGKPNGLGIFIDNKNRYYEGEWKNGMMNGIGLFKWDDGRKYFGMFNNDRRDGFGIFFWNNPLKIYLGFWNNGLQNGVGKILTSFKERYYMWRDGNIIKKFIEKKNIFLQIDKEDKNKMEKYYKFFRMNVDDLLTFILDL